MITIYLTILSTPVKWLIYDQILRDTIKDLGGTMPENLPKPKSSVKEIDKK